LEIERYLKWGKNYFNSVSIECMYVRVGCLKLFF